MIFLNIGSNLNSKFGNRFDNIQKSLSLLSLKKIEIKSKSSFYETPSYPDKSHPKFINISIRILYKKSYLDLLKDISSIEIEMGRIKTMKNEPRIIDIDIIDFNGEVVETENLALPHKAMMHRNFVLFPLREICPNWSHPISYEKIDILIKKLQGKSRNEITRIDQSDISSA